MKHTFIVWEKVLHRAHWELFLEAIDLVQEEDDACLDEPARVADGVEKCQSFLHAIDSFVFKEQLIVFGDGDQEEDCCDVLKAVYPFLTF